MSLPTSRRDQRYSIEIPVTLVARSRDVTVTTENVSYRGLFLRTDEALPTMELLRARVGIPMQRIEIPAHIIVLHVVRAGSQVRGAGAAFFGLDGQPLKLWEGFIQLLREGKIEQTDPRAPSSAADRSATEVMVTVPTLEALGQLVTTQIDRGTMTLRADPNVAPGAEVALTIVHPVSRRTLALRGTARRVLKGDMLVALAPLDDATRARLADFVASRRDDEKSGVVRVAQPRTNAA